MILETVVGGGVAYYLLRNVVEVKLRPSPLTKVVAQTQSTASDFAAGLRDERLEHLKAEKRRAQEKAFEIYQATLANILDKATQAEKDILLTILGKYTTSATNDPSDMQQF